MSGQGQSPLSDISRTLPDMSGIFREDCIYGVNRKLLFVIDTHEEEASKKLLIQCTEFCLQSK